MSRLLAAGWLFALASPALAEPASPGSGSGDAGDPSDDPDDPSAEIVGGTAVPPGKWPDAVAVLGQGSCTGTLIAPDVVLTAGHCADMDPIRVVADTTDYNQAGGAAAGVRSVTAHPSWDTTYDVAVIVLDTPITGVPPRKLGTPCTFEGFDPGTMVHLVGFGLTDVAGQGDNTRLNEAMAPVVDPDCSGPGGCVPAIRPGGEFIAGGDGTDSCYGDSGGPVYLDTAGGPVVIGAVSRGLDGAATPCGTGGIYVRTDKLVEWIEATAGKPVEKDLCRATPPPDDDGGPGAGPDDDGDGAGGAGRGGDVTGGCASSGGAGAGAILLVALALCRRR